MSLTNPLIYPLIPIGTFIAAVTAFSTGNPVIAYAFWAGLFMVGALTMRIYYRHHQAEKYDDRLPLARVMAGIEDYKRRWKQANAKN